MSTAAPARPTDTPPPRDWEPVPVPGPQNVGPDAGGPIIRYLPTRQGWDTHEQFIRDLIDAHDVRRVCDIGGGANPVIGREFIADRELDYCVLDISASELEKAPEEYTKIVADACDRQFDIGDDFDLIFSKMLIEHVPDAPQFHANVLKSLRPGGFAVHFFPTLYTLPFTINRLLPENFASPLLNLVRPRDRFQHDKFPAFYQWCRGPSKKQLKRFTDLGYEVVEYRGYYGHPGYYRRLKPLQWLHNAKSRWLLKHPKPLLTSFGVMVLRRPAI